MDRAELFNQYRPLLFSIAYRILGTAMEAEDKVQDTFLRWQSAGEADNPKAYLTTIVTRLCIDHLRSAKVQREEYIGSWLPEPIMTTGLPAESDALADSLSMAFLVVLESLSPVERAVFLLREVFEYDYDEIARIVEKTEDNCRQMVRRAKAHLAEHRPRYDVRREDHERIIFQFGQAVITGDMEGLLALLADDIVTFSDGGGKVSAARNPIVGADHVTRFFFGILDKQPEGSISQIGEINGQPAVVTHVDKRPYNVLVFDIADNRIRRIFNIRNPEKLRQIRVE
jgi:RNA polymerase sigma-70 factor, ECF subfamily